MRCATVLGWIALVCETDFYGGGCDAQIQAKRPINARFVHAVICAACFSIVAMRGAAKLVHVQPFCTLYLPKRDFFKILVFSYLYISIRVSKYSTFTWIT